MNAYHPDDGGLLQRKPKKNHAGDGKGGDGSSRGLLSSFMPGDKMALARQLSFGFGGSPKANVKFLNQTYSGLPTSSFQYGRGGGNGNGNGNGGKNEIPPPVSPAPNAVTTLPVGVNPNIAYHRQFGFLPMGMR